MLTTEELAATLDTTADWIVEKTGIRERRIAADDESTSDLGTRACQAALYAAGIDATDVDLLVCATSSPDWIQPATASAIHGKIGMRPHAGAFDVNAVCTGYIYALHAGMSMLAAEPDWKHVLVVGAECYSRILDYDDRRTCILFGDGAGAVVISRNAVAAGDAGSDDAAGAGIIASEFGTDFSQHAALVMPAGGAREPITHAAIDAGRQFFQMDGPVVRDFAIEHFGKAVTEVCQRAGVSATDIDLLVPHQSNRRILERALHDAGIDESLLHFTIDRYGNTAAASIPITLDEAVRAGRLSAGDLLCLVGYGGGLTWGSLLVRW